MLNLLLSFAVTVGTPVVPPSGTCQPASGQALELLRKADGALARREARAANANLDAALKTLGSAYRRPTMMDDTGMHLLVAQSHQRQGKLTQAARLKRRVLVERLGLCGATTKAQLADRRVG